MVLFYALPFQAESSFTYSPSRVSSHAALLPEFASLSHFDSARQQGTGEEGGVLPQRAYDLDGDPIEDGCQRGFASVGLKVEASQH